MCSGHGTCNSIGKCECEDGYYGDFCTQYCDKNQSCGGYGECDNFGFCECDDKHTGSDCSECSVHYFELPECNTHCVDEPTCLGNGVCNTTGGCTCRENFAGINCSECSPTFYGPSCSFICTPATCNYHGTCSSNGTCICADNFLPPFCTPVDKCQVPKNGGCDFHVSCNVENGSVVCGPCPNGTYGTGETSCKSLCGDEICNATIGEDCVTCKADCNASTCNACGDKTCNSTLGETCSTCVEDCGLCGTKSCPGKPPCSGNGICEPTGACICTGQWTGPDCSTSNTPGDTQITNSTTGATVKHGETIFSIVVTQVQEIDVSGNVVYSIVLDTSNFTLQENKTDTENKEYTLSSVLENQSTINISIYLFVDDVTTITFANTTSTYPKNALKIGVNVQNWPFRSLQNSLLLFFDTLVSSSSPSSSKNTCIQSSNSSDSNDQLNWLYVNVNGVIMYAQFERLAELDGYVREISFSLGSNNSVIAKVPHFWDTLRLDPNYNVLLGESPTTCDSGFFGSKKNKTNLLAVEIAVPVVVFLAVFVAFSFFFLIPKIKTWWQVRKQNSRVPSSPVSEMKPMNIEKTNEYSVNTSAGNFRLQV